MPRHVAGCSGRLLTIFFAALSIATQPAAGQGQKPPNQAISASHANKGSKAQAPKVDAEDKARSLWAYPSGVIVTSDGGRVEPAPPPEKSKEEKAREAEANIVAAKAAADGKPVPKPKEEEPAPLPRSNDEFVAFSAKLLQDLEACLTKLRAATPQLQTSGAHYGFAIEFAMDPEGKPQNFMLTKHGGTAPNNTCTEAMRHQLETHQYKPTGEKVGLFTHADYAAVVLNDDEAQGKGFQYYEGEMAWDRTVKANSQWFSCKQAGDCTVTGDVCELRAVNTQALADYRKAIALRKKGECYKEMHPERYKAVCRAGRCAYSKS